MLDTVYDNKIVAFVDILGFSELTMQSRDDVQAQRKIVSAMNIIHDCKRLQENFKMETLGIQITTFSDSVIISYPLTMDGGLFYVLMDMIHLQLDLLQIGIFIRGGISIGEVAHDENNVFGPAVVEAYKLESKFAIYPRIILSSHNIKKGLANSPGHQNEHDMDLFYGVIKQDNDEWFYLDFLSQFEELDGLCEDYYYLLKNARTHLLQNLNHYFLTDKEVYKKYKWFLGYWNDTLDSESISKLFSEATTEKYAKQMLVNMKVSTIYPHK